MQAGFEHNLGYCQSGTPLVFDEASFGLRNLIYVLPVDGPSHLAALDCSAGALQRELVVPETLCRVDEADLGVPLADITYLHSLNRLLPEYRVFVSV